MPNTDPALFADLGYCLFPDVLHPQETANLRRMLDEALATPLPHYAAAPIIIAREIANCTGKRRLRIS